MTRLSRIFCSLMLAACLWAALTPALAQGTGAPPTPPAAAPDGTASPAPAPTAPPLQPLAPLGQTMQSLMGAPAPQGQPPSGESDEISGPITDTFATGLLNTLAKGVDTLKSSFATLSSRASALSDFGIWLDAQQTDQRRMDLWDSLGRDTIIIIIPPLLMGVAVIFFFIPLRRALMRSEPRTLIRKIGRLTSLSLLRLVPVLVFLGAALLLLEQNETHRVQRFVMLNIIYAFGLAYTIRQILRGLFAPASKGLRLIPLSTPQALAGYRWTSAFSLIIVYSYFLIDVAGAMRVPPTAIAAFRNFFAITLTVMAVAVIFRIRAYVAAFLRGPLRGEDDVEPSGFFQALRLWLARYWHNLATAYLIIGLVIMLVGVDNSMALMLRGTILSLIILIVARLSSLALQRWKNTQPGGSLLIHRSFLAVVLRPLIFIIALLGLGATWGLHVEKLLTMPIGRRVFNASVSMFVTVLVLTVLYEILNSSIERHLSRRDRASARTRTLLPMLRNTVFFLFSAIALLVSLSALGFNIAPLLAGAGVVGVAIGFGSQSLIKDFLTGVFIVIENTIAVGDVVKIGTFNGVVETLSLRTIRLRDEDGSLHILPFSEVSKITNMTRGFAYALVNVLVAPDNDPDRVMRILREIGAEMQEDPVFKRVILEPIEVTGLEGLNATSMTFQVRIRTRPGKQWDVRRLLLLKIKQRFQQENIVIPVPTAA